MTERDIWFGTSGPRTAKIMVVGEAWGAEEARQQVPFVGESGYELTKMLGEAGLDRNALFFTNILAKQPPRNEMLTQFFSTKEARERKLESVNGLFPNSEVVGGLSALYRQVEAIKPQLIIGLGNYPFWAFSSSVKIGNSVSPQPTGWKRPAGIGTWRGSQMVTDIGVQGYRFLPCYHPAGIMRNWPTRSISVHDLRVRTPLAADPSGWRKLAKHYIVPPTFNDIRDYLHRTREVLDRGVVVEAPVDIETHKTTIACIGMTTDGLSAICIPFIKPNGNGTYTSYWTPEEEVKIIMMLRSVLNHPNFRMIGQNFLYDIQFLNLYWRVKPTCYFDTMVAQHVMLPGTPKSLDYLASLYNRKFYRFWKEDSKEWEETGDLNLHLTYNCDDCFETWVVYQTQKHLLKQMNMEKQFAMKMREWHLAFRMMNRGVRIDKRVHAELTERVTIEAEKRKEFLRRVVPEFALPEVKKSAGPWYQSAKQQMTFLYECLGLKSVHHRKTGNVTVDDTAIDELKLRYPFLKPILNTISELRSLGVFMRTYLSAGLDPDGRMRCSFNIATPETMRWSSSKNAFGRGANLQNISSGDEE